MENVLSTIASFGIDSSSRRVSSDWNRALSMNDKAILESVYKKYPGFDTIGDIMREASRRGDTETVKKLLVDYQGFLPVVRDRFSKSKYRDIADLQPPRDSKRYDRSFETIYKPGSVDYSLAKALDELNTAYIRNVARQPNGKERITRIVKKLDEADIIPYDNVMWLLQNKIIDPYINKVRTYAYDSDSDDDYQEYLPTRYTKASLIYADDPALIKQAKQMGIELDVGLYSFLIYGYDTAGPNLLRDAFSELKPIQRHLSRSISYRRTEDRIPNGSIGHMYNISSDQIPSVLRIMKYTDNPAVKDFILRVAIENQVWDILDKYINKDNILQYIQYTKFNPSMYAFLQYKGLRPEWFYYYYDRGTEPPESFWTKLLANAIVYGNEDLVRRIIQKHKSKIDASRKQKMLSLAKTPSMQSLLSSQLGL